MPGQGTGFRRDPFHEVAIAGHDIGEVIDDLAVRTIEAGRQMGFGDRHPHGIAQALPKGARGHFHARCTAIFGMTRRPAFPLAKGLQIIQGKVVSGQMKHDVKQHGGMTRGEDKTVPVDPLRIGRVMFKVRSPQGMGGGSSPHRHPGVS
ncbi:MAG: hypothetical protein A4E72_01069 [Syntrophus sp. PtaU1.Bin208]|nr:MAG: hypothetical protein A4E72_01069 [Syntrophus sp. PtaU1.Bin208]